MKKSLFVIITPLAVIALLCSLCAEDKANSKSTYTGSMSLAITSLVEPNVLVSNLTRPVRYPQRYRTLLAFPALAQPILTRCQHASPRFPSPWFGLPILRPRAFNGRRC